MSVSSKKRDEHPRVAVYGGSFDPVHNGHLAIAHALIAQFDLDQFIFIPASHAPHKVRLEPTSAYDRYTMLCLITAESTNISVSKMEIEMPERPFSVETLTRVNAERPNDEIFFVMGADSWMDIKTWREWEKVLSLSNHIVVSRPGYGVSGDHVTDEIRERIVDLRKHDRYEIQRDAVRRIYLTDSVNQDVSATEIRKKIRSNDLTWHQDVPNEVANYIEKYQIYS